MRILRFRVGTGVIAMALASCFVFLARDARATLGGDVASIDANQAHLGASRQVAKLLVGERHDLSLPSGILVRQYVSPAGLVYGVEWSGPRIPDLRELLGTHFEQIEKNPVRPHEGVHRLTIVGTDLVVRAGGHRGSFEGRAWVPSLLPAGVRPEESLEAGVTK